MSKDSMKTTCPYCGVGCGIEIKRTDIVGDESHPANAGLLCTKGAALSECVKSPRRLLVPTIQGTEVSWEQATDEIAERMFSAIAQYGPESVAMYLSGQLLTEDYYVANKLMKGFVGSSNIETNTRLCMMSAVSAHIRAFGEDVVPVNYDDIEQTEMLILVGANSVWTHPVLYRRIEAARANNPNFKLVVIDPRETVTSRQADLHLCIESEGDVLLFNGLLRYMIDNRAVDSKYIKQSTDGFGDVWRHLQEVKYQLHAIGANLNVEWDDLRKFYDWFMTSLTAITMFGQGVNQSQTGVDKANAIINCHLASGKIGKPGCGPFSLTGQPNAMGGREVGVLSTQLAVHRGFDPQSTRAVQDYWQSPVIANKPGLKTIDMFDAIEAGQIKVLWIIGTNPAISMPDSDKVRQILRRCSCVIVSDISADSDTLEYADVVLPASGWGEKRGMVTNAGRILSRQRAFTSAPGMAKPDWWSICQVGGKLCELLATHNGFEFPNEAAIFREYAGLTAINETSPYQFHLSRLAGITDQQYSTWQPRAWPFESKRPFADGVFSTPDGRARFVWVSPPEVNNDQWWMNSGRHRDQWHTMTRTGSIPRLASNEVEPTVYLNSASLKRLYLTPGYIAQIRRDKYSAPVYARVAVDDGLRGQQLFMSIHWANRYGGKSNVNRAIGCEVDDLSGQPAFKSWPVEIEAVEMGSYGLYIGHERPLPSSDYRCFQQEHHCGIWRFANIKQLTQDDFRLIRGEKILRWELDECWMMITVKRDEPLGLMRITGLLAVSDAPIEMDYLQGVALIGQPLALDPLMAFSSSKVRRRLICACYRVTDHHILGAIEESNQVSLNDLQQNLKCGTNCGSCLVELKSLIQPIEDELLAQQEAERVEEEILRGDSDDDLIEEFVTIGRESSDEDINQSKSQ
ncbi:nitrate reductase [Vibrio nitrifigilis]|uniref:Molybdopterin-dependent oxidoreductase n=1 Tax=Vibrio nitrifigilis TaxID=2789781 RepID=A0ABS0GEI4_9VIBR|nr:molybdopterin-dependent oxidoreductase [Vibrio nitrifigilis]